MNRLLRAFCLALALVRCGHAPAQVTYDGYEELDYLVHFEHAGERDGEFKLLFSAHDGQGHHVREWIRPGGYFLGHKVEVSQRRDVSAHLRRMDYAHRTVDTHVPLNGQRDISTVRGTFALTGRGDEIATAYVGDEFQLGDLKVTLRDLLARKAEFTIAGSDKPTTAPLSSTGGLRTELYLLRNDLSRRQYSQWQEETANETFTQIQWTFIFLLAAYVLVYGCILVGWLTRDRHLELRR